MPTAAKPPGEPLTYAKAGVDLEAADHIVELIRAAVRRTHSPRVLGRHGGFAGMFRLDFNEKLFQKNYREPVLVACADGVGTKIKLAAELGVYDTVGIDCVAMNVNDLMRAARRRDGRDARHLRGGRLRPGRVRRGRGAAAPGHRPHAGGAGRHRHRPGLERRPLQRLHAGQPDHPRRRAGDGSGVPRAGP
ncbi:MAG: hypothetical protein ACYTA3_13905 [Planctomycetota bacterium]